MTSSVGRLAGRVALVTGASRGIGRAIALELARQGAHVIALARTVGALEELDDEIKTFGESATLVPLDLRDAEALPRLAQAVASRWNKLDILIGNAGVLGKLTPLAHLDEKTWAQAWDVNVTANWRLIRAFDVLLKRSDAGRALFVTSGRAERFVAYWGIYAATKAALNALVKTYAAECATTNVRANLLSPGRVRTAMRRDAFPGENPETLPAPEEIAPAAVELVLPTETRNGDVINLQERIEQ
ncbi:MAG: SDR family NAD(P)-dependent oxidoreductase [Alphaproteobacteria bacterium]|nr:SDR family NAD(P)-dependent oxidoreductase [Alphaproteobacteria bacterium]